jgi:hypothetical protein
MSDYTNIFIISIIIIILSFSIQHVSKPNYHHHHLLKPYCVDRENLEPSKPILWIFVPQHINSRNWKDFYSRNSNDLNLPYLYITLKSIIDHCSSSFNILFINQESFTTLLPEWHVKFEFLTEPIKDHFIQLGMHKLLLEYGGMSMPCSFLCTRDLIDLYHTGIQMYDIFVIENVNASVSSDKSPFLPDCTMMGCIKNHPLMEELVYYETKLYNHDLTSQSDFNGDVNVWLTEKHLEYQIVLIDGTYIGVKRCDKSQVLLGELLSTKRDLRLLPTMYGILIPYKQLLSQLSYQWFIRMSTTQILESELSLVKYI